MVEGKKFTRKSGVQSAFLFLFNYVLLLLVITFFIFLNSLEKQADSFIGFFSNQPNNIIYLASSIFMLYLAIYLYYLFEDKNFLATPKNIFLLFSVLGVCIVVCYFFSYFFNIYARPIGLLALLALLLLGMRDAIFLNIIFALMMFSIDNFTNFTTDYAVALLSLIPL